MSSSIQSSKLFEPLQVGKNHLTHRIALSPMTRFRNNDDHAPNELVAEYYAQRASVPGTLVITEATIISSKAGSYANSPGVYTNDQIAGWKKVVDAVHAKGSSIWLQLWALGRVADPKQKKIEGSGDVVGPSAIPEKEGSPAPRPLTEEEIQEYIRDFADAARNAVHKAGFDGVEIHGANGYLVDQFIQDKTNQRTDRWGGSVENRSRFAIEVSKAVVDAIGSDRTAIRLSPWSDFQGMKMDNPVPQFTHLVTKLKQLNLAYLHLIESRVSDHDDIEQAAHESNDAFIDIWGDTSPILLAGGMTVDIARKTVDDQHKDKNVVAVFGRLFIPNPDLVYRVKNEIPLTSYDRSTFYDAKNPKGYADWSFSKEWETEYGP